MRILTTADTSSLDRLVARDAARSPRVAREAARIVDDVRRGGDGALERWMRRLDDRRPPFEISRRDVDAGWRATAPGVRRAIRTAARAIERVATRQLPKPFSVRTAPGVRIDQRVQALERVGCYVPGGRYPLPSTLLMTVIPARVAGVTDIIVTCPRPTPEVLCAAREAGATRVVAIGGAQAIAALAYGTASIPRVDKIVGPGNAWVAAAKALVAADCSIDFQAGPSEIVICTNTGRAAWIAWDLIAQAEHDPDARACLVTTSTTLARRVAAAVDRLAPETGPARTALARNGAVVIARGRSEAVALVNRLAPEHLVTDAPFTPSMFTSAGTVFSGAWTAQASGDYATGSNHVLPTGGSARVRGGLSAADFVRTFSVQTVTERGLRRIGPAVVALATAEGLDAHAESIRVRLRT